MEWVELRSRVAMDSFLARDIYTAVTNQSPDWLAGGCCPLRLREESLEHPAGDELSSRNRQ
jgi:hypothetical protein